MLAVPHFGRGGTWIATMKDAGCTSFWEGEGEGALGLLLSYEGCWLYLILGGGRGRGHLDCYYHIKVPHFGRGRERGALGLLLS